MGKRLMLFISCLVLSAGMAFAQKTVSGTVLDEATGETVIGATVTVKGYPGIGAATDINGKFTIKNVPNEAKFVHVSYLGMKTKEVAIKNLMQIFLEPDTKLVDEVMVIAFGQQTKSSFTGSAAIVGADQIQKMQVTNAIDALKGKAAGVQINTSTGQPGSTPTIRIRGYNSINAGKDPLIVVDGSPFSGSLNDINPMDVESITTLKDAASTALYGARGGNGVILVTTKQGKRGQDAKITVDAKVGANMKATQNYDVIGSPARYYELWYKGLYNYAQNILGANDQQAWQWANQNLINNDSYGLGYQVYTVPQGQYMIGQNGKLNPNATLGYLNGDYYMTPDNWMDETYSNSMRQEYSISATGGSDKVNYYASANYLKNEGITVGSDYERFTSRFKADMQVKPWMKLGANMSYGHYVRNYLGNDGESGSSGNAFAMVYIAPIYPMYIRDSKGNIIYDEESRLNRYDYGDGNPHGLVRPYLSQANPLSANQLDTQETEGNTFSATGSADITLPFGFKFTSLNNVYLHEYRYTSTTNPFFGQYASQKGHVSKEHYRSWSYNYQQRLDWHQNFGNHEVDAMLGHEFYRDYGYDLYYSMSNQFSVFNKELAGAVVPGSGSSSLSTYNTESWMARAMYNYDKRYFAQGSVMRQASSRFHKDNWWGTFYSFSAGWLMNNEHWFNVDWVDELKFKASYGENGNDQIGSYRYVNYYDIVNSNDAVSLIPSSYGNPEISWEKNAKFNVGFDFSLFNGRFGGSIEYYENSTYDMLSWVPFPASFGWSGTYANIGDMKNSGIEVDLHGDVIRSKNFTWSLYANMTTNTNEITMLAPERRTMKVDGHYGYSSGSYFYGEGLSMYSRFGKKYAGVYSENTWQMTEDEAYDPSKAGLSMFFKNTYEVDANGAQLKGEDGFPIENGQVATTAYNDASDYVLGDVLPEVYGGFGTSFDIFGFDLSVDFTYQLGGYVYDGTYASLMSLDQGFGIHEDMLNAWSPENTGSNIPRMTFNDSYMASNSDRFLTDASFLSLQNVTLGYTLPKSFTTKFGVEKLRLYVVGDNLWVWSKRKGLDPRQSATGSASSALYSSIRTISGGVSITF